MADAGMAVRDPPRAQGPGTLNSLELAKMNTLRGENTMQTSERSGLICPCCAPALVAGGSTDISVLPSGWAVRRSETTPIHCACGVSTPISDVPLPPIEMSHFG
jgi:hypothetical protein